MAAGALFKTPMQGNGSIEVETGGWRVAAGQRDLRKVVERGFLQGRFAGGCNALES